jgi:hypothetical protein
MGRGTVTPGFAAIGGASPAEGADTAAMRSAEPSGTDEVSRDDADTAASEISLTRPSGVLSSAVANSAAD